MTEPQEDLAARAAEHVEQVERDPDSRPLPKDCDLCAYAVEHQLWPGQKP